MFKIIAITGGQEEEKFSEAKTVQTERKPEIQTSHLPPTEDRTEE